jgi:hypothetical protein
MSVLSNFTASSSDTASPWHGSYTTTTQRNVPKCVAACSLVHGSEHFGATCASHTFRTGEYAVRQGRGQRGSDDVCTVYTHTHTHTHSHVKGPLSHFNQNWKLSTNFIIPKHQTSRKSVQQFCDSRQRHGEGGKMGLQLLVMNIK